MLVCVKREIMRVLVYNIGDVVISLKKAYRFQIQHRWHLNYMTFWLTESC